METVDLQYWHAELNKMFFNGELEPAIINWFPRNTDEDGIYADFFEQTKPFLIQFYIDLHGYIDIFLITILLHEMVHQYCSENHIDDTDGEEHKAIFAEIAEQHGLREKGYALQESALKEIEKRLKVYNKLISMCSGGRRGRKPPPFQKKRPSQGLRWLRWGKYSSESRRGVEGQKKRLTRLVSCFRLPHTSETFGGKASLRFRFTHGQ